MRFTIVAVMVVLFCPAFSQKKVIDQVKESVTKAESEAHLTFLASDEMRGRDTGSPEIAIAANYLRSQLKIYGAKPVTPDTTYFQTVELETVRPAKSAHFIVGADTLTLKDDILYISGGSTSLTGEIVFVGYGSAADFEKANVKNKIVLALAGTNETTNAVQALLTDSPAKAKVAAAHGATALVEVMLLPGLPWTSLAGFLSTDRMMTKREQQSTIPHVYMKRTEAASFAKLMETRQGNGTLRVDAPAPTMVDAKNVAGAIEGSDPILKNEWIVISAHYDHVGVKKTQGNDSIFNGARDNAIGTTALLHAAKFFGKFRPKRSVLFLAVTAEEKGLLGSEWYSNHPLIPLNQTVFNYNCDGAGYNDTTIVTLIDLNRTSTDETLKQACAAFGLSLKGDPAPEQNLYERSDNLNFAVKGIPAVDIAPGITAFDKELFKYYHQPPDEVASLNMNYIERFHRAFVYGAYLIANAKERPQWKPGDKFEPAGKKLYGK